MLPFTNRLRSEPWELPIYEVVGIGEMPPWNEKALAAWLLGSGGELVAGK